MAALVLAGCGSGGQQRAAPQPKLPRAVATELAARSDQVAAALEGGDRCGARMEAERLQRDAIKAINDRRVARPFQEHLGAAVNDLVSRIHCTPPADEGESNQPGKRKGHKKDGKGDD